MPGIQKLLGSTPPSQKPEVLSEVQGHSLLNSKYTTNLKYIKSCLKKEEGIYIERGRGRPRKQLFLTRGAGRNFNIIPNQLHQPSVSA